MTALHQLLGALHDADAVGREALAVQGVLRSAGVESEIFSGSRDASLAARARPLSARPRGAAFLYHFAPGSRATAAALAARRLALLYHNVTPASLLVPWALPAARLSAAAARELQQLAPRTEVALAHSEFSRAALSEAGYPRSAVIPFALDLSVRDASKNSSFARAWGAADGPTFLLVGRAAPNKRIEAGIRAFATYQRRHSRRARLLIVGETHSCPQYVGALRRFADQLKAPGVVFSGRLSDKDLRAAYALTDALLCLSAHEGYGVPLVEAMACGVPVIANDAGAVRETLAGGGVLLNDASPLEVADLMAGVERGGPLREPVLATQAAALNVIRGRDFAGELLKHLAPLLVEAA